MFSNAFFLINCLLVAFLQKIYITWPFFLQMLLNFNGSYIYDPTLKLYVFRASKLILRLMGLVLFHTNKNIKRFFLLKNEIDLLSETDFNANCNAQFLHLRRTSTTKLQFRTIYIKTKIYCYTFMQANKSLNSISCQSVVKYSFPAAPRELQVIYISGHIWS